jgi:mannitol-1-/sugar-/sorbitol-6-/2-deoxyglucose-6-phosphatase
MFRAAIFDMDGLLIDSEPYWQMAERTVFGSVGIEITAAMSAETAPLTPRQVTEHWYRLKPWAGRSLEEMEAAVIAGVAEQIRASGKPLPGVREVLALCREQGWRVGLASNSPATLCRLVLSQLAIEQSFHAVVGVDQVERGKPDPSIYLHAAQLLGVPSGSMPGVRGLARRSAGGSCRGHVRRSRLQIPRLRRRCATPCEVARAARIRARTCRGPVAR